MKANNDVTETLQRTIGLMQGELERSVLSTQLLGGPQIPLTRDHSSPEHRILYRRAQVHILHARRPRLAYDYVQAPHHRAREI